MIQPIHCVQQTGLWVSAGADSEPRQETKDGAETTNGGTTFKSVFDGQNVASIDVEAIVVAMEELHVCWFRHDG